MQYPNSRWSGRWVSIPREASWVGRDQPKTLYAYMHNLRTQTIGW